MNISRLRQDLSTNKRHSEFAISRGFYFHEAQFRENKVLAKIFEFTASKSLAWFRNSFLHHVILNRPPRVDYSLVVLELTHYREVTSMLSQIDDIIRYCCIASQRLQELLETYFKIKIQW